MTASVLNKGFSSKHNHTASFFTHANTSPQQNTSSGGTLLLNTGGAARQTQRGNLSQGMYLKMDDLTEIMDQLNLENDHEMKKIIDNGKSYNRKFPILNKQSQRLPKNFLFGLISDNIRLKI